MENNITFFGDNLFNRSIFSKSEIITMVKNFTGTINKLGLPIQKKYTLNEIDELARRIGFIDDDRVNDLSELEKELGNDLFSDLVESINHITRELILENKYLRKYSMEYRQQASTSLEELSKPTLIDLFCGSGGLSLGLVQSGMRVIFANDIEKAALQTYTFNHPEIPGKFITMGGIEDISKDISKYISETADVVAGGPPCQGFSMANRQRLIDDPRNKLYKYYVECVTSLKPKVFIMENVKGMLKVANQVVEDFNTASAHYDIFYKVLNARNFSVPQNRERLIYIGIRRDIVEKHKMTAEQLISTIIDSQDEGDIDRPISDALQGLRPLEASRVKNNANLENENIGYIIDRNEYKQNSEYLEKINGSNEKPELIFNHKARYNNDRDIEIYGRMLPGDRSDSPRIADIMPYTSRSDIFKDKYFKLIPSKPSKTITAHMKFDCNMYIHPLQSRGLTPREAARIQSYPDDFFFQGAFTKTYQQVGNSVPPLLAKAIGQQVMKLL